MPSEIPTSGHVLIAVSNAYTDIDLLLKRLLDALSSCEIQGGHPVILSASRQPLSAEIGLAITPAEHATLADTLTDFDGDIAILGAQNRKKQILICDMDSTIIAEECLDELADFAGLKAQISAITERAMAGELNFEDALTSRVAMLEGLPISAITDCYQTRIHLNEGARTLVATMRANGAECQLVSGGFTDFTSRVARAAGFHSDHANTLLNDGTRLTGKVGLPILGREAKLDRLTAAVRAQKTSLDDAICIGDGANDLAMIEAAGLGVAYRAKPIVAARARAAINHTDLTTALYFQGYNYDEFITPAD